MQLLKSYRVYYQNATEGYSHKVVEAKTRAAAKRSVPGAWRVEEMTPESEARRQESLDRLAELDKLVANRRRLEDGVCPECGGMNDPGQSAHESCPVKD